MLHTTYLLVDLQCGHPQRPLELYNVKGLNAHRDHPHHTLGSCNRDKNSLYKSAYIFLRGRSMHFVTCTAYYVSLRLYMHAGRSDLSAHNSISAAVSVPVCVVCPMCSATANTAHSPDYFEFIILQNRHACMMYISIHISTLEELRANLYLSRYIFATLLAPASSPPVNDAYLSTRHSLSSSLPPRRC